MTVTVIGLWIAVSPAICGTAASITRNNALVGGAVFLLTEYNYYRIATDHSNSTGATSLVALPAVYTVAAPVAFEWQFAMADLGVADFGLVSSNAVS